MARESTISGWGRIPVPGREVLSEDLEALTSGAVLSRGLGRSYGDSALPPPSEREVATTTLADRLIEFDPATGHLRCESGVSLADILDLAVPAGADVMLELVLPEL